MLNIDSSLDGLFGTSLEPTIVTPGNDLISDNMSPWSLSDKLSLNNL